MSQHDYNLANQSGANFRADLNNALGAIATNNSGSSEPSTTFAYEWWVDTSSNVLKIRNSANNAWITLPISVTADNTVDINGGTVNGISSFSFSSGSTVTTILDEDNLASDSATALATQQSIKAYVDSQVTAQDLDISDGSSSISIDLDSESLGLLGGTGLTATASGNNVTFAIGQAVGTGDDVQFNQVTSALVGNASTATALATARAIALSGDVVGTANFDGTAGISISTTIQANSVALGTDTTGNYVATIAGTTNEIEVSGSGSETAGVTVGLPDDVTIAGNLTVNGTTTTVNTSTLSVEDPLIKLANNNSGADSVDIGFYGLYDTSGSQDLYAGLFRDANDSGKFKLFKDLQTEPTTTVNTSGTGYAVGTLVSNLEGNITSTLTSNLSFADNSKAIFGSNDLEIYSDGTHSYIEEKNASGNFYIKAESFNVGRQANSELYITAQPNDAVKLHYDNSEKLSTATDGIDIKGSASTTFGLNIIDPSATAYGAHFSFDDTNTKVLIGGVTNGTKNTAISIPRDSTQVDFASNITLPDSASIKLGASSDLQLFHDGGNSFIREAGTGNLYIEGAGSIRFRGTTTQENLIEAVENGAVSLYYDNSVKIATSSAGVDISGQAYVTGGFTSDSVGKSYTWRAIDNSSGSGTRWVKICRVTGYQSARVNIELSGRAGYGDNSFPAHAMIVGQINNDNNYDFTYYNFHTGTSQVVTEIGQVDIDNVSTDIYLKITDYTEIVARAMISDGNIYPTTGNSGASQGVGTEPTGYVAFTEQKIIIEDVSGNANISGRVGIGTTSLAYALDLANASGGNLARFKDSDSSHNGIIIAGDTNAGWVGNSASNTGEGIYYQNSINAMRFYANGSEKARLTSTGLGIGTTPSRPLHVVGADGGLALFSNNVDADLNIQTASAVTLITPSTGTLAFGTSSTERARLDDASNLMIGGTNSRPAEFNHPKGISFRGDIGQIQASTDANTAMLLNRDTSDGTIVEFRKEGSAVGSIGVNGGRLNIGSDDTHIFFDSGDSPSIRPHNGSSATDGVIDIGESGTRFKDLHLSGAAYTSGITTPSGDLTLDVGGDITFDADGGDFVFKDGGTSIFQLQNSSSDLHITSMVNNKDIIFRGNDEGSFITALTLDMSDAGSATFNHDAIFADSGRIKMGAGLDLQIYSNGTNGTLEIATGLAFRDSSGQIAKMTSSGHLALGGSFEPDSNLHIKTSVDNSVAQGLVIERSANTDKGYINYNGGGFQFRSTVGDPIVFGDTSNEQMRLTSTGLGLGTSSPSKKLHISSTLAESLVEGTNNSVSALVAGVSVKAPFYRKAGLTIYDESDAEHFFIGRPYAGVNAFDISNRGTSRLRIDSLGNTGIGTSSPSSQLHLSKAGGTLIKLGTSNNTSEIEAREVGGGQSLILSSVNSADHLVIDGAGNVGIGTDSPDAPLTVHNSSDPEIRFGYSSTQDHKIAWDSSKVFIHADPENANGSSALGFSVDGSEAARFDASGNLLVGGTSENAEGSFTIRPNTSNGSCLVQINRDDTTATSNAFVFYNEGVGVGSITYTNTATAFNTSSDARLKDVTGTARGLEVINELNPVAYNWKVDGKADEGLIAQEVKELVPNAVVGSEEDMYSMDYSKLVVHLVAGMKEQQELIEDLQTQINNLRGE